MLVLTHLSMAGRQAIWLEAKYDVLVAGTPCQHCAFCRATVEIIRSEYHLKMWHCFHLRAGCVSRRATTANHRKRNFHALSVPAMEVPSYDEHIATSTQIREVSDELDV
jgi:hypothetical protein